MDRFLPNPRSFPPPLAYRRVRETQSGETRQGAAPCWKFGKRRPFGVRLNGLALYNKGERNLAEIREYDFEQTFSRNMKPKAGNYVFVVRFRTLLAGNPPVPTFSRLWLRSQGEYLLEVATCACKTPFSAHRFNPALTHIPSQATPARTRRTAGKLVRRPGKIHCSACNQGHELFSMSVKMRETTLDMLSFEKPARRAPRN